jgi:hypothetical protein
VIAADAAFAGVLGKAAGLRALVQRRDRIGGQRAKAHCRDIVDRGVLRARAIGAADLHPEIRIEDLLERIEWVNH